MTLPDADVLIKDAPAARSVSSFANWFVVGLAERGPANTPLPMTLASYGAVFGAREANSPWLYDSADVFLREGGRSVTASRLVGPDAASSDGVLVDTNDDDALLVTATSPGAWGDGVDVEVVAGVGSFTIEVSLDDEVIETSSALTSIAEAVAWAAASSNTIDLQDGGGEVPEAQTIALANGTDDRANVTATEIAAALAAFTADYGPGQVSIPGFTTTEAREALLAHAAVFGRIAKLDGDDTSSRADIVTDAIALRDVDGHRFAAMFVPWDVCPGILPGTERTVPPTARNAALLARSVHELGGTAGDPAAGTDLAARFVTGLSQEPWTDADRELLNDAGVNVSLFRNGSVVCWGNRTLTSDITEPNWAQLNQSNVLAAIKAGGQKIAEPNVHKKVDGRGTRVGSLAGQLEALCSSYYGDDDLYGATPEEAYEVVPSVELTDAGATVLAAVNVRVSPGADRVELTISKTPTNG